MYHGRNITMAEALLFHLDWSMVLAIVLTLASATVFYGGIYRLASYVVGIIS